MKKVQKIFAMLLTFCMLMSMLSVGASAAETICEYPEAHTHTSECEGLVLNCGKTACEKIEHTHDGVSCKPHEHSDSCYSLSCNIEVGTLTCTKDLHTHGPECCTLVHEHGADCVYCSVEEHTHGPECCTLVHEHGADCVYCTKDEHTHGPDCCTQTHQHGEGCSCSTEAHTHGTDCYHTHSDVTGSCYTLNCEQGGVCEQEEHTHSTECHIHSEDCYVPGKICGYNYEHTHTEDCYPFTGTITEDMVWNDGDVIGNVTIAGNVTITVKGTVTVAGTIRLAPSAVRTVTFNGENDAKLIRGCGFTGQMFYAEGTICYFHNLIFNNITLDGGAVWTGEVDAVLGRGTTNEGIKATGSVLYLYRANAILNNSVLQNHDDSTGEQANAVFLREYATVAFYNSVARNNNSPSGYWKGGVVATRYGGSVTAENSEVYGNSASHGGFVGISSSGSYGAKVECVNTKIHHNYASTAGAAFYLQDNYGQIAKTHGDNRHGYLKLTDCTLKNNGSPDGLIYSYVYYMPAWIEDTTIADNDCAVYTYGSNESRSFSVAGSTQISGEHSGSLYEAPVRLYDALDSNASILMDQASIDHLMANYGYLVTEAADISEHYNHTSNANYVVPYEYTSKAMYDITMADLDQIKLPENSGYTDWVLTDVDGNGMLDAVPVSDASAVVENVPICDDEKPGYFFAGWSEGEDGTQTATWKVARPQVSIEPDSYVVFLEAGDSIDLEARIGNWSESLTYTYQWYREGTAIEGATEAAYTAKEDNAGDYVYKCVVTATDAVDGTNTNTYNKCILLHYDVSSGNNNPPSGDNNNPPSGDNNNPPSGDNNNPPSGGNTPPSGDTELPEPEVPLGQLPDEELEIPEEDVPLASLPEEEVPLGQLPDEELEIPEEDVPLASLPEEEVPLAMAPATGDASVIWMALSALSGAGLFLTRKKRDEE